MGNGNHKTVNSPVPGKVVEVKTTAGAEVKRGDLMVIVEAMKMYNRVLTPFNGVVKEIVVSVGQKVSTSDPLVIIEAE
ncbi:MAG TPA: biotin/lipoyl-containing protein [Spirochaetia bacterium]|nr:biotin/lipoyl-containing protein [Spirochaetia bacterium]